MMLFCVALVLIIGGVSDVAEGGASMGVVIFALGGEGLLLAASGCLFWKLVQILREQ